MPWEIHGISYGYSINYGSCKIQNGISQGYPRDIPRDTDSVRIIGYPWDIPGIYSAAWGRPRREAISLPGPISSTD